MPSEHSRSAQLSICLPFSGAIEKGVGSLSDSTSPYFQWITDAFLSGSR